MLNIIKKTDPIPLTGVSGLFYGQSGIGKTSLGGTAQKSLLLCFENGGMSRADRFGDSFQVKRWTDIPPASHDSFKDYDTIVMDTLAAAVDSCMLSIVGDGKMATIKHYGQLKTAFKLFYDGFNKIDKNVIFLAHASEPSKRQTISKGEVDLIMPVGGSGGAKDEIYRELHFVAYIERGESASERIIHFDGGENVFTKNSYGLGRYNFSKGNETLLDTILTDVKEAHHQRQEKGLEAKKSLDDLIEKAEGILEDSSDLSEKDDLLKACEALDPSLVALGKNKIYDLLYAAIIVLTEKIARGEEDCSKEQFVREQASLLPYTLERSLKMQIKKTLLASDFILVDGKFVKKESVHAV